MIPASRPRVELPDVRHLLGRRVRSSRRFRLVALDELTAAQRERMADLTTDPDFFGLLAPAGSIPLGVKAVDRAAADLFQALREPCLPGQAGHGSPSRFARRLAALVLDGVLEVEEGGRFWAGPAAIRVLGLDAAQARHPLAQYSARALVLAASHPSSEPWEVARWLYASGSLSLEPASRVHARAGLPRALQQLEPTYELQPTDAWWSWRHHSWTGDLHLAYKLYLSPRPGVVDDALAAAVPVLLEAGVPALKLGRGAHGLLRPDKLVAYLPSWEALRALARGLVARMSMVPAQGVPFTAPLDARGLVSWGMDPPADARLNGWSQVQSWRLWLVRGLARALVHATGAGASPTEAARFARLRLALAGVDTATWLPASEVWEEQ